MLKIIGKIILGFGTFISAMIILPIIAALIAALFTLTITSIEFILTLAVLWLIGHVVYEYYLKRKEKNSLK